MKKKNMHPSKKELERVRLEGVIEIDKLHVNTSIFIETNKHVFEFILEEDSWYVSSSNLDIISGKQKCTIAGCTTQNGTIFAGLIVLNTHLIIGLTTSRRYVTGLIKSGSLHGPGWAYEIWPATPAKIIGE